MGGRHHFYIVSTKAAFGRCDKYIMLIQLYSHVECVVVLLWWGITILTYLFGLKLSTALFVFILHAAVFICSMELQMCV